MSFITTKFQVILLSCSNKKNSSIFHFGQISKFKKGVTPRKKGGIKISCGYAHVHIMSFITTCTFYEILLSSFRGVALTRKTGLTDWLTDWLTDGSKTLYPPQLVAWGIIIHVCLCAEFLYTLLYYCIHIHHVFNRISF